MRFSLIGSRYENPSCIGMRLEFEKTFLKEVSILPPHIRQHIAELVVFSEHSIWKDIHLRYAYKKLKGSSNAYRIRIGDYRIGFTLEPDETLRFIVL